MRYEDIALIAYSIIFYLVKRENGSDNAIILYIKLMVCLQQLQIMNQIQNENTNKASY
jgi:hypothetical protein